MKQALGWAMVIGGMVVLGAYVCVLTCYRFAHEKLTETELALWSFERWWAWVPAGLVSAAGLWLAEKGKKRP